MIETLSWTIRRSSLASNAIAMPFEYRANLLSPFYLNMVRDDFIRSERCFCVRNHSIKLKSKIRSKKKHCELECFKPTSVVIRILLIPRRISCIQPAIYVSIQNLLFIAMNSSLICHIINTIDTVLPSALLYISFFRQKKIDFYAQSAHSILGAHGHGHGDIAMQRAHIHSHTHTVARSSHNSETRNTIRNVMNVLCVAFGTVLRTFFSHNTLVFATTYFFFRRRSFSSRWLLI